MQEEQREPGTHFQRMCQVPLVTCILFCYTKITKNSVYLLEDTLQNSTPCDTPSVVLKSKNIALMVKVCIASFKMIGELHCKSFVLACALKRAGCLHQQVLF